MLPKVTQKLPIFPQRSELFIASKTCLRVNAFLQLRGERCTELHVMLGKGWLESREVSGAVVLGWLQEVCFPQTWELRKTQVILSSCGNNKCWFLSGSASKRLQWGRRLGREGAFVEELGLCNKTSWGLKNNFAMRTLWPLPDSKGQLGKAPDGISLIHCWPCWMVME